MRERKYFDELPPELKLHIFSFFGTALRQSAQVSTGWNNLAYLSDQPAIKQQHIEEATKALVDLFNGDKNDYYFFKDQVLAVLNAPTFKNHLVSVTEIMARLVQLGFQHHYTQRNNEDDASDLLHILAGSKAHTFLAQYIKHYRNELELDKKDAYDNTPFELAVNHGQVNNALLLLANGATLALDQSLGFSDVSYKPLANQASNEKTLDQWRHFIAVITAQGYSKEKLLAEINTYNKNLYEGLFPAEPGFMHSLAFSFRR